MRRTEVRPMLRRRAISDLLRPELRSFLCMRWQHHDGPRGSTFFGVPVAVGRAAGGLRGLDRSQAYIAENSVVI